MKYCENCGAEMEDTASFCSHCGQPAQAGKTEKPRDLWAERLAPENLQTEEDVPDQETDPVSIYFPEEPPKSSDARVRRLTVVVSILFGFVVILVLVMIAMVALRKEPIYQEVYYGRSCVIGETEYPGEGDWVSLRSDGTAELSLLDKGGKGKWEQHGPEITLECGEFVFRGRLGDGILILETGNTRYVLALDGLTGLPENMDKPEISASVWEGDYYGWWEITKAWGQWKEAAGSRFDACGRIFLETDTEGKLELWDTECRMDELFCAADIQLTPGKTEAGCLESIRGRFCDFPLEAGQWRMDPGREPYLSMPGILCLEGSFQEEDSGFSYVVFLRPWGMEWEDVKDMPSGPLPQKKRLPEGYTDWYLPLIQRQLPMPESFHMGEK